MNQTALLVMDYQVGLLHRLPDVGQLLERANTAIARVRANSGHVGWVRVGFTDAEFDAIPPTSVMARVASPEQREHLGVDAPATQIHEGLDRQPYDVEVRKVRVGAFTTTDLDRQLRDRGVTSLLLAGISTSGVVLSTLREAMDRDYAISVVRDACADPDPATHEFLVGTLYPRYATVLDVADL
ncbi:cysteine hydrolase family protein [Cryptosporangium sp. NPDC051539]|uniref:cysteine hydrolase family protein n=1 Tax=Cryptosporangium sp. NPDC051539 TaxID=3363962 RepID=UPI0037A56056